MDRDQSSPVEAGAAPAPENDLRPIKKIWAFFKWMLLGYAVFSALLTLSQIHLHVYILRLFEGDASQLSEAEGIFIGLHQGILALLMLLFLLLCIVGYARFFQRSMHNARQIEPGTNTVAPVGMWLWFAVPIANLWFPFQGVRKVWEILRSNAGEPTSHPPTFALWWIFWILSNLVSNIALRLPGGAWDFELTAFNYQDLLTVNWLDIASGIMAVISSIALYRIASTLARLQIEFEHGGSKKLEEIFE
ncbi:DUF4328 domain-containing protein [Hyphobacterium sp.]|uniref:DUF4328 domain-containing protein n=1 Tax=Hyphobacterium sp. TaxID=2004662 RepID=UPI003BAC3028